MIPRRATACHGGHGAVMASLSIFGGHHVRNQWLRFIDPYRRPSAVFADPSGNPQARARRQGALRRRPHGRSPRHRPPTARAFPNGQSEWTAVRRPSPCRCPPAATALSSPVWKTSATPLELTAHTADIGSRSHQRLLELILIPQIGAALVRITRRPTPARRRGKFPIASPRCRFLKERNFASAFNRTVRSAPAACSSKAEGSSHHAPACSLRRKGRGDMAHAEITAPSPGG